MGLLFEHRCQIIRCRDNITIIESLSRVIVKKEVAALKRTEKVLIGVLSVMIIIYGIDLYISNFEANKKYADFVEKGKIYFFEGEYDNASAAFNDALRIKNRPDIEASYYESIRMNESSKAYDRGIRRLEEYDYKAALNEFQRVVSSDKKNYSNASNKVIEIQLTLADNCLIEAIELFNEQDYIKSYSLLKLSLGYNPKLQEAIELLEEYTIAKQNEEEKIADELDKIKTLVIEEAKKQETNQLVENMKKFERGQGPVGIAVRVEIAESTSDGFTTYYSKDKKSWFVQIHISAKNYGESSTHINGKYFTLSTLNGYTVNPHKVTYSYSNFLDNIALLPDKYSSGWLTFYVPIAEEYILNYNSPDSIVYKRIIAN